jgi:hypothetical protein
MAIGALPRKDRRAALFSLLDEASGATRLGTRITLEQAPEGRQHAYYALESFSDVDNDQHRGRGRVMKAWTATTRLAFSLVRYANDMDAARDAADDAIDNIEQALYQPRPKVVAEVTNLDVTSVGVTERVHDSREWLVYDLDIRGIAAFDLGA